MYLTKQDFDNLTNPYFAGRWEYLSVAIGLMQSVNPTSILEIGTNGFQLNTKSETVDIVGSPTYQRDITNIPWNLPQYDLVVALQVWEHLGTSQLKCFLEARRHSQRLLLSLPLLWDCPDDLIHHNIDRDKIREWTNDETPTTEIVVGNETKRVLLLW